MLFALFELFWFWGRCYDDDSLLQHIDLQHVLIIFRPYGIYEAEYQIEAQH